MWQRKMLGPRLSLAGDEILLGRVARRDAPGVATVEQSQGAAKHLVHSQSEASMQERSHTR